MMLRFRLASHLGKTYQELTTGQPGLGDIEGIPELYWWMAYMGIERFGDPWEHTSLLCTVVANAQGNSTRPSDFYPTSKTQTAEEQMALLRQAFPAK